MLRHFPSLAVAAVLALSTSVRAQTPLNQWVQYAPGGIEARAIVDATSLCPSATVDGANVAMKVRAAPGDTFPVTVCALPVPAGTKRLAVAGKALALPKARPDRILLVGDTGCRLSKEATQSCGDASAWPFPAGSVVEAGLKPDLVIHLRDFHYREAPCPLDNRGCVGSPYGDTWAVWRADFFDPAKPLLEAAPFVFVRGNHEECARGGKGWSRTLDPYPAVSESGCLGPGAPFLADLGGPKLIVMDVSTAAELRASPRQVEIFRKQFRDVAGMAPTGPVWLAFHRPIWASGVAVFGFNVGDNKTLAEAGRNDIPANVDMILSGHIHTFQIEAYKEDLPIQIISGHGGDELHKTAPADPTGLEINGVTVKAGRGGPGVFGFVMLEREPEGWRATNYDLTGRPLDVCHMKGRNLACD